MMQSEPELPAHLVPGRHTLMFDAENLPGPLAAVHLSLIHI